MGSEGVVEVGLGGWVRDVCQERVRATVKERVCGRVVEQGRRVGGFLEEDSRSQGGEVHN